MLKRRELICALGAAAAALLGGRHAAAMGRAERVPLAPLRTPLLDPLRILEQDALPSPVPLIRPARRLPTEQRAVLQQTLGRLRRLQRLVGYGHFNLLDYQAGLRFARNYSRVGAFTAREQAFMEEIFFADAREYGFYGEKVIEHIDARVNERQVVKIPRSGHYLYKGEPLRLYQQVRKDIGQSIMLTSGIRNILKQMYLFLNKLEATGGNLSEASRSLAPPGHSFHGSGDFDVGKIGFGARNFTEAFARTDEFRRLTELGYVIIRYPNGNPFGVRYEPWHIKVA